MTKINVQKLHSLSGHQDCVYTLQTGAEPHVFYSAGGDGVVACWDMRDPENGQLLAKMKNSVYALHLIGEKNLLVVGQNFEGIHLIDTTHHTEVASLKISDAQIFDIKSHGNVLYVCSGDGTLYLVDLPNLVFIKKIKLADKSIRAMAINPMLDELALGLSDNSIRILDLKDHKQKYGFEAHKLSVFDVQYNPHNNHLISVGRDAQIRSWDAIDHYAPGVAIPAHMYAINSLSISPDKKYFVTGSMDKSIKVWELDSYRLLKVIDKSRHAGHATSVNKVLWTSHHNQVLSGSDDKKISIWDLSFI
ncbi:MAG: WD40 repeat domain-containing protein [Cyclobacteriaceae bacterium]|nr:WD40 repeat domain-containing protein [Cyclobacteriaceae bacterium]